MSLPLDLACLTADRRTLEDRLIMAFEEIELEEMPPGWCWQQAAGSLAEYVVEQMLFELGQGEKSYRH